MANYTYECLNCLNSKEVKHPMSDAPMIECDLCGAAMIKLLPRRIQINIPKEQAKPEKAEIEK